MRKGILLAALPMLALAAPPAMANLQLTIGESAISASTQNLKAQGGVVYVCEGQNLPGCTGLHNSVSDIVIFITVPSGVSTDNKAWFISDTNLRDSSGGTLDVVEVPQDVADQADAVAGGVNDIGVHARAFLLTNGVAQTAIDAAFANPISVSEGSTGTIDYIPTIGNPGFSPNFPGTTGLDILDYRIMSDASDVPEPWSLALFAMALAAAGLARVKRSDALVPGRSR